MSVLLTGASGFIGSGVLSEARKRGMRIQPVFRTDLPEVDRGHPVHLPSLTVPNLDSRVNWTRALSQTQVIVHAAALAASRIKPKPKRKKPRFSIARPVSEFREVNVKGTLNLARQASMAGVKRFIFLSSVKVHGNTSQPGRAYTASDLISPMDSYAMSKAEAESGLLEIGRETGMEITIIRPVLVYGPGVKGYFLRLMRCIDWRIPLPVGLLYANRRSLVALENLVDLILTCVTHPKAGNQVFMVSDAEDISTGDLIKRLGAAMGRTTCLLPVPKCLLWWSAQLTGQQAVAERLLGNLQVNMMHTQNRLNWHPAVSLDAALRDTAEWYRGGSRV